MDERLTLEVLLRLSPLDAQGRDIVTLAARDLLLNLIKQQPRVHEMFFPDSEASPESLRVDPGGFPLARLATAYVAEAVSEVKDEFLFHSTVNRSAIQSCLRQLYTSLPWKKLGLSLYTLVYPDVVKDSETGVSFREYLNDDSQGWAKRILKTLSEPQWTRGMLQRVVKGSYSDSDYNQDMNELFVKMHLLDPQSVIPAYQQLLSLKEGAYSHLPALHSKTKMENEMNCACPG